MEEARLTKAFEDRDRQQELFYFGRRVFRDAMQGMPRDRREEWDGLCVEREAIRSRRRGWGKRRAEEARRRELDENDRRLRSMLMAHVVPLCFGHRGAYKGVYDPISTAEVLLDDYCDFGAEKALQALVAADIPDPSPGSPDLASPAHIDGFDPLDPSTWATADVAIAMLCPSGDAGSWAWSMKLVFSLMIADWYEMTYLAP